ncbi:MAG: LuxR C-terminal-related transcriptional regulator [Bacteroidota bacterium]
MNVPNIVIAHSYEIYANGLRASLIDKGHVVERVINNGPSVLQYILKKEPDVVLLQEEMATTSAFEIIRLVGESSLKTRFIIIYNNCDQRGIILSQWAKANGSIHLGDSSITVNVCITKVLEGENYYSCSFFKDRLDRSVLNMNLLSFSERRVLKMISLHECTEKVAANLNLSRRTIEKHRSNIINKLDLDRKTNSLLQWVLKNKSYVDSTAFQVA